MANYSCKKFSLTGTSITDRWIDRQTNDNHANSSTITDVRSATKTK